MITITIPALVALAALIPAAMLAFRRQGGRDSLFWAAQAIAFLGPAALTARLVANGWNTALSADLWIMIAVTMLLYAVVSALDRAAWRLSPLLLPYLVLLGVIALACSRPGTPDQAISTAWLDLHIVVSVATIGLLTLAAVSALGSFLQARALKLKKPNRLTRILPPVADSERLSERLLALSELVLGGGAVTGMATQYLESGSLLKLDHKILFTLLAFVVIGLLLVGRRVCGVRGQIAARVILLSYLLVILGYFGVKFVHQVLLG